MRMSSSVNGHRVVPTSVRPELDTASVPPADNSHGNTAANAPDSTVLAPYLTVGAHLVRLAF